MTDLTQFSEAMADSVARAGQSVVRVDGRRRFPATGIVWDADTVVTAHHVLERNENIMIGLPDGETMTGMVIGRDPNTDLALVRVAGHGLSAPALAQSPVRVGQLVLAVGRPGRDLQASLGIVSGIGMSESEEATINQKVEERLQRRAERMAERAARRGMAYSFQFSVGSSGVALEGAIQTDVLMYPGFSGGALIDAGGGLRGMNTSGLARGTSLAVPLATIQRVAETLLRHGRMKKSFLGVGAQAVRLPESLAEQVGQETGLLVVSVETGSPADRDSLLIGDVLYALDGYAVRHIDELLALLNADRIGKAVPVQIIRGGELKTVEVTLGERD